MDLQKEREAFLAHMRSIGSASFMFELDDDGNFDDMSMAYAWSAWQAAKAQAIPGGYKVVPVNYECVWCGCTELGGWTDEAMIEAQEPKFNLDEFLTMEEKLKHKGGVITADLDRFIAHAESVLSQAKALKEPK